MFFDFVICLFVSKDARERAQKERVEAGMTDWRDANEAKIQELVGGSNAEGFFQVFFNGD